MAVVTMREMLESGVHFGHQTRRWNPKMKRFILTDRSGIYIIDLQQSVDRINDAYDFVKNTVSRGGNILFVGTKKQAQETVADQAGRVGQPYVNQRWLGGLLTNFQTVTKRLERMKELEQLDFEGGSDGFTKKELLLKKRELDKLQKSLGGIRNMSRTPSALWVVDTNKEHLAIAEARSLGIPVIAVLDTNCDPDDVAYPVPGNDDSIRSVALLTRVIADAVAEGLIARQEKAEGEQEAEPLAEWELELLAGGQKSEEKPVGAESAKTVEARSETQTVTEEKVSSEAEAAETTVTLDETGKSDDSVQQTPATPEKNVEPVKEPVAEESAAAQSAKEADAAQSADEAAAQTPAKAETQEENTAKTE